jgi:hypothetical protein
MRRKAATDIAFTQTNPRSIFFSLGKVCENIGFNFEAVC